MFRMFPIDPESRQFLEEVTRGEIPQELVKLNKRIEMDMEDHRDEDYKAPPKPKYIAFSGEGNSMSDGPKQQYSTPVTPTASNLTVDESQPTFQIQIRLNGGSRLVQKFNESHTVGDLRNLVASKSGVSCFKLMTQFPNQVLENDGDNLKAIGLAGAVVVQR